MQMHVHCRLWVTWKIWSCGDGIVYVGCRPTSLHVGQTCCRLQHHRWRQQQLAQDVLVILGSWWLC